ncbi:MAG: hypothetical protein UW69_C0091G0001 [Microgenomates group bacterium GW2011_GWA2_44_7]|nr:MAG: hypothetical protein UW69_C0091G0001 [Microgenomates group bacterium GW2011_GWA2_44_7]KKT77053.1 MAG: hypothetical protein UW73_C0029G0015 [Microgenomates group bacterium GW2011_GWB1_44_8]
MEKASQHKIIGIANLFLGILLVFFLVVIFLGPYPKLGELYTDFGIERNSFLTYGPVFLVLPISALNIFSGVRLLNKANKDNQAAYKLGIVSLVISSLMFFPLVGLTLANVVWSVYQLTSALQ